VLGILVALDPAQQQLTLNVEGTLVTYPVMAGARVFRHGLEVPLSQLLPGDRIYLVVSKFRGQAAFIDAARFEVQGELLSLDPSAVTLTLRLGDNTAVTLKVGSDTPLFLNGRAVQLSDLKPGDQVYCALEAETVVYLEAYRGNH